MKSFLIPFIAASIGINIVALANSKWFTTKMSQENLLTIQNLFKYVPRVELKIGLLPRLVTKIGTTTGAGVGAVLKFTTGIGMAIFKTLFFGVTFAKKPTNNPLK